MFDELPETLLFQTKELLQCLGIKTVLNDCPNHRFIKPDDGSACALINWRSSRFVGSVLIEV